VADRSSPSDWEHFHVEHHGSQVALRTHHGKYVCAEQDHRAVADRSSASAWEQWHIVPVATYQIPHYAPPPQYPPAFGGGFPPAPSSGYPPQQGYPQYPQSPMGGYPPQQGYPAGLNPPGQYPPGHY
jgi:hypothetical protein